MDVACLAFQLKLCETLPCVSINHLLRSEWVWRLCSLPTVFQFSETQWGEKKRQQHHINWLTTELNLKQLNYKNLINQINNTGSFSPVGSNPASYLEAVRFKSRS